MSQAPPIAALLVFGDSLCDGGNARALRGDQAFRCPPHWRDRRCNGPLWVEQLAERLALPPLVPSLTGGSNHAVGGARSGAGLSPKGLPNLLTQVEEFLAGRERIHAAGATPPAASFLVVLRAGANDYLDAVPSPAVGEAVNHHLLQAVAALVAVGFRRFLVPNELPWGFSPIQLPGVGEAQRRDLNRLIECQNMALERGLAELAAQRGVVVVQPDFHAVLSAVVAQPGAWGFREIHRPALGEDGEALDAGGVLWWDSWGHLTTAFHRLLAEQARLELERAGCVHGGVGLHQEVDGL